MKLLLIVNPSASSVTARTRIVIQKALSADHRLEVAATTRRGHATRLAQSAANDGMDVVVVLGGDGTLNEAANGLAGTDTALAALPGGSTNVFARTIGLPDDAVEATGALLDAIEAASIRRIGLGAINDRYFLFHAGIGFDADFKARLFQRFEQADGSITRRFGGTGLGLAISRALAEAMEGELEADSVPGRGSTFTLKLNLSRAPEGVVVKVSRPVQARPQEAGAPRVLLLCLGRRTARGCPRGGVLASAVACLRGRKQSSDVGE